MDINNIQKIKEIVAKIDTEKIANYPEHPQSLTLRQIIEYKKRIIDSSNEKEIFRLTIKMAYKLEMIVNRVNYVKDEAEKKHLLEISEELFMNTKGPLKK